MKDKIIKLNKILKSININKTNTAIQDSISYIKQIEKITEVPNNHTDKFSDTYIIFAIENILNNNNLSHNQIATELLNIVKNFCIYTIQRLQNEY